MMQYIQVMIIGTGLAYQEVNADGVVVRYLDASGAYLYDSVPEGVGSYVTDPAPVRQAWML